MSQITPNIWEMIGWLVPLLMLIIVYKRIMYIAQQIQSIVLSHLMVIFENMGHSRLFHFVLFSKYAIQNMQFKICNSKYIIQNMQFKIYNS